MRKCLFLSCGEPQGALQPVSLSDVEYDLAKVLATLLMAERSNDLLQRKADQSPAASHWLRSLLPFPAAVFGCPPVKPASAIAGQGPARAGAGSRRRSRPDHRHVPSDAACQHGLMQGRWAADVNDVVDAPATGEMPYAHAPLGIGTVVDQIVAPSSLRRASFVSLDKVAIRSHRASVPARTA